MIRTKDLFLEQQELELLHMSENTNPNPQASVEEVMNKLDNIPEETIKSMAKIKVDQIISDSQELVLKHFGKTKDELSAEDKSLISKIGMFSIKEVLVGLESTKEAGMMKSIIKFWDIVSENIKAYK